MNRLAICLGIWFSITSIWYKICLRSPLTLELNRVYLKSTCIWDGPMKMSLKQYCQWDLLQAVTWEKEFEESKRIKRYFRSTGVRRLWHGITPLPVSIFCKHIYKILYYLSSFLLFLVFCPFTHNIMVIAACMYLLSRKWVETGRHP